jgi:DNA-binding LacI/PurR family transcriptional regulator
MKRSVSIKDIALADGVSPSTVSRALHHHPRISEATATRIRRLAEEMGYSPSLPARSLVTRHTATIGLVITHASDPFLGRLVIGVEEAAQANGYSVFLSSSYRSADLERKVIRDFHERRVTGIIVTGSQMDAGYLELRERYPLPIVLINFRDYPQSVSTDNLAGAQQAVDQALHVEGDGTLEGGLGSMRRLLALSRPPTAVFCFNDVTAMGVLRGLNAAGVRVPHDCSVIGFDDLDMAAYYCPPLTTVRQPSYRLGQRAMRMLLQLIQGREDVESEVLPAELVVRETTGPVPASTG